MKRLIYSTFASVIISLALGVAALFGLFILAAFVRGIPEDRFGASGFLYFGSGILFLGISFALARLLYLEKPGKPDE